MDGFSSDQQWDFKLQSWQLWQLSLKNPLGQSIRATRNAIHGFLRDRPRLLQQVAPERLVRPQLIPDGAVFAAEISPTWSSFTFFVILIAVLVIRPQGLFGVTERGAM